MFGDERYGDHQQMLLPFPRQSFQRLSKRRLQPFLTADAALKAQQMFVGPAAESHHGGDRLLDLALVRIAALDEAERQAMGAEDELDAAAIGETGEGGF